MADEPPAPAPRRAPTPDEMAAEAVNVTGEFADLAPEDQVFRLPGEYLVKVKTLWDTDGTSRHGRETFKVTGSIIGKDGKTLRRADGNLAIHDLMQVHIQQSDAMRDPLSGLEMARRLCAASTVRAEKYHEMFLGFSPGLATVSEQRDRKAAEEQEVIGGLLDQ